MGSLVTSFNSSAEHPIDLPSTDSEFINKLCQQKLLCGYIRECSDEYNINIPIDIIKLCLSFSQIKFKWTINTKQDKYKSKYYCLYQVSLFNNTAITANIEMKYEIEGYHSMLSLKVIDDGIKFNSLYSRVYCHIICNELKYERKYTATSKPTIFSLPKPNGIIIFDCYFEIISQLQIINKFKSNCFLRYNWKLNEHISHDLINNFGKIFYSSNFNDNCLYLSMYKANEDIKYMSVMFRLYLLNKQPLNNKVLHIIGVIKVFYCVKQYYQCELKKGYLMHDNDAINIGPVQVDKSVFIKSIQFNFQCFS